MLVVVRRRRRRRRRCSSLSMRCCCGGCRGRKGGTNGMVLVLEYDASVVVGGGI